MAFLAAENENLQLDGRFAGGRLPSVGKDKVIE